MAEIILTGSCGDNATFNLYDDGLLEILGTGGMKDYGNYTTIPWYNYRNKIKAITFAEKITSIGQYAFYGCTGLTSITIMGNGVTSIGQYAFYGCTGLTSITIPDSVTSISGWTFFGCTGLTNITIPNSITSIRRAAFQNCTSLTSVTIPENVTTIERQAFGNCTNLELITMLGTTPPTLTYSTIFIGADSLRINVPFSSLDAYKTANYWENYANIIHGVESLSELFTRIANSIRSKTGKTDSIVAHNFPEEIEKISSNN